MIAATPKNIFFNSLLLLLISLCITPAIAQESANPENSKIEGNKLADTNQPKSVVQLAQNTQSNSSIDSSISAPLNYDAKNYFTPLKDMIESDLRYQHSFRYSIVVDNLIFWGLEAGFYPTNWLFIGVSYKSLDLVQLIKPIEKNYDLNISVLNLSDVQIGAKMNIDQNLSYFNTYLELFPFEDSGFFMRIGNVVRNWEISSNITVKNYDDYNALIDSPNIGSIKITAPKNAIDTRLGWNWLSNSGFSANVGIGMMFASNLKIEIQSSNLSNGSPIISEDERIQIEKIINDKLDFTKRMPVFFFGFGQAF